MLTIETTGLEAIKAKFAALNDAAKNQIVRNVAQAIYNDAEVAADKHTKTGALRDSLFLRPFPGGWMVGHNLQRAPHAIFVHWGTRAHLIQPGKKKVLRWASGGSFIFAKIVHHPGYKGDPYLVRAANTALANFDKHVQKALKGI